jgi:hypothetical protein
LRHDDDLFAGRTIDLRSRIAGVAQDLLDALRAEEFEFSHKFDGCQLKQCLRLKNKTL